MNKILIVEDNEIMQECYQELLIPEGYQVISAVSGEEALEKLVKYQPDIMLLDLSLKGMDGRSVIIELRKRHCQIPTIIVSDKRGMMEDPEIKLAPMIKGFLNKPVDIYKLLELIEKLKKQLAPVQEERSKRNEATMSLFQSSLAEYDISELILEGHNGSVYKGSHQGTPVVIKVLSSFKVKDTSALARFRREAEMLQRARHRNIIELLDLGQDIDMGMDFLVMPYFPGKPLDDLLYERNFIEWQEASSIVAQIADGMGVLHRQGLVHRDLKPSNILYHEQQKLVKIIDFGIVKEVYSDDKITQTGMVVGTPLYMAPEQCLTRPLDHRCDIYSLGAVFFHLVTGNPPFDGGSAIQAMMAQVHSPVIWPELLPDIPDRLREIVDKMMEKDPEKRYSSMEEVREEILRMV